MSDVKGFGSITMGKTRKSRPQRKKEVVIQGCRVFPLRIALLRMKILDLPTIYRIKKDTDLEDLLKSRVRLITELKKENY